MRPEQAYLTGALLIVIGTLIQDVVADAMSTEVVVRVDAKGNARAEQDIRAELGMVQVLGRLALSFGILAVAGLSGWLAGFLIAETVFLLGLIIPAISVLRRAADPRREGGAAAARPAHPRRRAGVRRTRDRAWRSVGCRSRRK